MQDTLGDRCKHYEAISEHYFTPKVPILVRVDGKAFHTWTKSCHRPFDPFLISSMFEAAKEVAKQMQGCRALYAQSDEVTFVLTDDATIETQQWFGGRQNKIESIAAAMMTAYFNKKWNEVLLRNINSIDAHNIQPILDVLDINPAVFDARAFQCPKEDVSNILLWRVRDWERNSLNMFCERLFSHKELQGRGRADRHEMLHKIGRNWATECTDQQKNGSWWSPKKGERFDLMTYYEINTFIFE